jgi:hypothetical protein
MNSISTNCVHEKLTQTEAFGQREALHREYHRPIEDSILGHMKVLVQDRHFAWMNSRHMAGNEYHVGLDLDVVESHMVDRLGKGQHMPSLPNYVHMEP